MSELSFEPSMSVWNFFENIPEWSLCKWSNNGTDAFWIIFFPVGFNPNQVHFQYQAACHQSHHHQQYPHESSTTDCNSFQLQAAPKVRRSRASRSRCPCLKCCSARVNGLPSPSQHLCIIKGCQKSYSRPAHLRNHLKTHQNQSDLKCGICLRKFITSEMLISHMSDEHEADLKLFWLFEL